MTTGLPRLLRVRRGVRVALALGIAASLAANVLHADADAVSRVIAAWPPVALAITVELVSRVPTASRWLSAVRILGTASVAGIAAWVSYWHMAGVAARYGEDPVAAHMIPLSVDGLIVVASVCLVELGRHTLAVEADHGRPDRVPTPDRESRNSPPGRSGIPPQRSGRELVADLVAAHPDAAAMTVADLADDIAPRAGLSVSTTRKYISSARNGNGAP